jgi:hypothetical protein
MSVKESADSAGGPRAHQLRSGPGDFDPAKLQAYAAALRSNDVDFYPNPDLAVAVDVSKPKIDRPGIYAALEVPEIWRAREQSVSIEQLDANGKYAPVPRSRFLPVRSEDVTRWIFREDSVGMLKWEDRLREWVRTELVPRTELLSISLNVKSESP